MLTLRITLGHWETQRILLLLLATSGLLLGAKCEDQGAVRADSHFERRLDIWLNVVGLQRPSPAGTSGWFTYDLSDQRLQRIKGLDRGEVVSVARNVPMACVLTTEFAGHGYESKVVVYRNSEVAQTIELGRTGPAPWAALSDDGTRLAVAYVGAPDAARPEQSPVSAWQGRLDLYDCNEAQFVLAKTGPWPKPMNAQADDALKWLQWAPDGKSMVCEQDRQVWKIVADLSETQSFGPGKGACWSPDGQLLAIADWEGTLVVQDIHGRTVLKKADGVHSGGMAWLDNRRIAIVVREYHVLDKPKARLCILDVSTQKLVETPVVAHSISVVGVRELNGEQ